MGGRRPALCLEYVNLKFLSLKVYGFETSLWFYHVFPGPKSRVEWMMQVI